MRFSFFCLLRHYYLFQIVFRFRVFGRRAPLQIRVRYRSRFSRFSRLLNERAVIVVYKLQKLYILS